MKEMKMRRSIPVGLLALSAASNAAYALDPGVRISQYAHTVWRMQEGAFSGTPHAVAQTADGYLWIGTDSGLFKFDGVRFVPWEPLDGKRLAGPSIYSLLGGSDGTLWIGSSAGLASLRNNNLFNFENAHGRINAILQDHAGQIWATRSRPRESPGGLCQAAGQELQCFGTANGMDLAFGGPLLEDNLGNLWVGSSRELLRWKSTDWNAYFQKQLKQYAALSGVEALAPDENGTLWVGFGKKGLGLQKLVQGVPKAAVLPGVDASNLQVTTLFVDRDQALWIGTFDDGVYRFHGDSVDHFRSEDGLSGNTVDGFFEDREGNLWVLTTKGVDIFRANRVASFSVREGLAADLVDSVLASRDGTIWIGNHEALDVLRGERVSSIREREGLPGHRVTSLFEDHAGRIWVGVDDLLTIYQQGRFHRVDRPDGSPLGIVRTMTEDTDQNIWAVDVRDRLLFRIQDQHVSQTFTSSQIPYTKVLAADPTGGIWLGLINGNLARYRNGKLEIFPLNQSSPDFSINGLLVDEESSVWVATNSGLLRWKAGTLNTLSKNSLPCQEIFAAVRDNDKKLWLYTRCGLIAISESELKRWWQQPERLVRTRILDVFDGAQPSISTFQPQVSKSPDGRLWFANDTVLQVVDPARLHENSIAPPVDIEEVVADRKNYPPKLDLVLSRAHSRHRNRLHGAEFFDSAEGPVPLQTGWTRSGMAGRGDAPASLLQRFAAWSVPVPRDRLQRRRLME